jgi:hypothetical protein
MGNCCSVGGSQTTVPDPYQQAGTHHAPQPAVPQPAHNYPPSLRDARFEGLSRLREPGTSASARRVTDSAGLASSSLHAERPDLSNIDNVGEELAVPRLKQALRPFLHGRYNMFDVANQLNVNGVGEGVCAGLSLEWINAHATSAKGNRLGPGGALTEANTMHRAVQLQTHYERTQQSLGTKALQTVLAGSRYRRHQSIGFEASELATLSRRPGYQIWALAGVGTGHVITTHRPEPNSRDQRVTLFDPNQGEFKFEPNDAEYFFTALTARLATLGIRYHSVEAYSPAH